MENIHFGEAKIRTLVAPASVFSEDKLGSSN